MEQLENMNNEVIFMNNCKDLENLLFDGDSKFQIPIDGIELYA